MKESRFVTWKRRLDISLNNVLSVLTIPSFDYQIFSRRINADTLDMEMKRANPVLTDQTLVGWKSWKSIKFAAMNAAEAGDLSYFVSDSAGETKLLLLGKPISKRSGDTRRAEGSLTSRWQETYF